MKYRTALTATASLAPHENRNLTTEEASSFLGLAPSMLTKLRQAGVLPAVIISAHTLRFRLSDLIAYRDDLLHGGNGVPAMGRLNEGLRASQPKAQARSLATRRARKAAKAATVTVEV